MAAAIPNMSRVPVRKRRVCGASARAHGTARRGPLVGICVARYASSKGGSETAMKQLRIGDVTIDAVIEREGPWRRPQDFFRDYDDAVFKHHLKTMEPEVFDTESGKLVMPYQTFVVRSPRYTILVDTCTGADKGHPAPFDFPGKERWRNELFALGVSFDKVDYVFCTHLHIDHTGWKPTLRDGRWVPSFPNAKYIFHKGEYAAWEAEHK